MGASSPRNVGIGALDSPQVVVEQSSIGSQSLVYGPSLTARNSAQIIAMFARALLMDGRDGLPDHHICIYARFARGA